MRVSFQENATQEEALVTLARLVEKCSIDPQVVRAARTITSDCEARSDECELAAIYEAVKNGDPRIPGLGNGVRYVSDSRYADQFNSPARMLQECAAGACAGDCDDHAALVACLASSIGFKVGLRAYGPRNAKGYSHVYAVAYTPKRAPRNTVGLDTTVPYAKPGWQPPRGRVMTAVIE